MYYYVVYAYQRDWEDGKWVEKERPYSAQGVSSAPTLFTTEGKAAARMKTHFKKQMEQGKARVVRVILEEAE